ncbi:MAG: hypothetical protein GY715_06440 [Planctomycetes bacterium]|nr:hypothetical protein [Planctomycetota bacterium]
MRMIIAIILLGALGACGDSQPAGGGNVASNGSPAGATAPSNAATTRPAATQPTTTLDPTDLRARIAKAHGIDVWRTKKALAARIVVDYANQEVLRGEMIYEPVRGRVRMNLDNGAAMIWDGERAWTTGTIVSPGQVRFHVRTWPYFLFAPFKLGDPGTRYEVRETMQLLWQQCETGRIMFEPGVGDSTDWMHFYCQPGTDFLLGMGYIVSYGTFVDIAEEDPHSIIYEGFDTIDGVTLATNMRIQKWRDGHGPRGNRIGNVAFDDLRFITPEPGTFTAPPGATEDPLPEPRARPVPKRVTPKPGPWVDPKPETP